MTFRALFHSVSANTAPGCAVPIYKQAITSNLLPESEPLRGGVIPLHAHVGFTISSSGDLTVSEPVNTQESAVKSVNNVSQHILIR